MAFDVQTMCKHLLKNNTFLLKRAVNKKVSKTKNPLKTVGL
jgi:hypothetical protein